MTVAYDSVAKRWRATCSTCQHVIVRAKRESAEHVMAQHETYSHGK